MPISIKVAGARTSATWRCQSHNGQWLPMLRSAYPPGGPLDFPDNIHTRHHPEGA